MRNFFYRLMFTKGDEMDLSQFYLLAFNALFIVWVVNIGLGVWALSQEMLDAFLIVYATTVVLSSPTWLVKLWLENQSWFRRTATGAVQNAKSVATALVEPAEVPAVAMIEEAVPSTDVSEMNHAGVLPAVAPTEFPLPEPTTDSPTSRAWVG